MIMNKVEGAADHSQTMSSSNAVSSSVPLSFSHPPAHFNYPGIYCGMEGDNAAFYPPVTVMPLKFDDSLCIMDAMNKSQPQGLVSSTPKLENFFGGTTMGTHHYEAGERRAMALGLDSMYYHQSLNHESSVK